MNNNSILQIMRDDKFLFVVYTIADLSFVCGSVALFPQLGISADISTTGYLVGAICYLIAAVLIGIEQYQLIKKLTLNSTLNILGPCLFILGCTLGYSFIATYLVSNIFYFLGSGTWAYASIDSYRISKRRGVKSAYAVSYYGCILFTIFSGYSVITVITQRIEFIDTMLIAIGFLIGSIMFVVTSIFYHSTIFNPKNKVAQDGLEAMQLVYEGITGEEFSSLSDRSGMRPRSVKAAKIAIINTLYMVGIRDENGTLIAFGRIVGDGATSFIVDDIMVDKRYHRQGYGRKIMDNIDGYINRIASEDAVIMLIADVPADKLYVQYGFKYMDPEKYYGMYRNFYKD